MRLSGSFSKSYKWTFMKLRGKATGQGRINELFSLIGLRGALQGVAFRRKANDIQMDSRHIMKLSAYRLGVPRERRSIDPPSAQV